MKKYHLTQKGPRAIGPYSTCTIAGGCCYVSGMLGVIPEAGALIEGGVEAQARRAFENMRTVLEEVGLTTDSVLKTTVFLTDLNNFAAVNQIYGEFFGPNYPARSCVEVSRLPMNGLVEIEAIATVE